MKLRRTAVVILPLTVNNRLSQCACKNRYTKREAIEQAKLSAKSGRVEKIGVYPCSFCKGWHLTHKVDKPE